MVLSQLVEYLLSYLQFTMPAHERHAAFPHLFAQILYHSIHLICVILLHIVLSQLMQYLLSYPRFTMPAHQTHHLRISSLQQGAEEPSTSYLHLYDSRPLKGGVQRGFKGVVEFLVFFE